MNLGYLIDRLQRSPQDNVVRISGLRLANPSRVTSYRGYYEDLAIVPAPDNVPSPKPVRGVIALLESAIGREFTGWKGGEFRMTRDSRVWIAESGEASGLRIYAVEDIRNSIETFTSIIPFEDHFS